ncbi:hypothetical protein [Flavobacterium algicola]|uniref:hypothetical protein n=1 Tax=Flavobacterium algicola TaxID=556529 RepID=UPI001EFCD261|nr:hypothetical protein [Flavobacterium algicola]MCG9794151.1 hypothetical protein [Flavobacterium algicola]
MFIEIEVRTALIVHGYDVNDVAIEEKVNDINYIKKLVAIERIQSISEQYILVTSSHNRIMYWEYKETMQEIKQRLQSIGVKIA